MIVLEPTEDGRVEIPNLCTTFYREVPLWRVSNAM